MKLTRMTGAGFSLLIVLGCFDETRAGDPSLASELVVAGLSSPVFVTHAPGDFSRIFIVEQGGRIRAYDFATQTLTTYLDITNRVGQDAAEKGLLGLAFHPDWANNGFLYVNYTEPGFSPFDTRVSRFTAVGDPMTSTSASAASELVVLSFAQPFANHNGGWIGFGPLDGFLYIATGDGGAGGDPMNASQDITNQPLGKILRIDVDGGVPFAIPPTNPFVGSTGDDEIWSYGLRNPWRCAFDAVTGDLYIADVGQNQIEEIDFQPATGGGENWGWRCLEGSQPFTFDASCEGHEFSFPVHEYTHGGNPFRCSVTGGEVYRGCAISGLSGTYFFGDFCSGQIWSFRGPTAADFQDRTAELDPPGALSIGSISSFGVDAYGEIYICDLNDGEVFRIVSVTPPVQDCNGNGIEDRCDISSGASADADVNGIPDEVNCNDGNVCTADSCDGSGGCGFAANVYGDLDRNGVVNLFDVFCMLDSLAGVFETCTFHATDIQPCAGDSVINVFDLFALLDSLSGVDSCCGA